MMRHTIRTLVAVAALAPVSGLAQEGTSLESDWIELVKGHKGATLGLELRDIQVNEDDGTRTVTLAVPKESIDDPDTIEEVVVRARGPQQPEPPAPLPVRFQWLDDYDADNYGLVIHLGEGNWPIRLYLNSRPGYVREE
ncbi:hypothetical protein F0M18_07670 [Pseudohalioglobus sediminis]|uniref:Uncharacterized protein n=1 Tax=Pseudohalioglobus sediminis TaxID=2606449 RepID=A0A5B0X2J9_9GAMM|nr:hypothetical protein [Pseudohalioglobus sediminis]KAA1192541.1 hypothetical protein F0M18_07670 [Pseudohalioglobus sediminis]